MEYLENEILREVLVLVLGEPKVDVATQTRSSNTELSTSIRKIIEFMELSLFSKLQLDEIAKSAGLSRASLMRAFQRELNQSPMAYVRSRRLEEARRLIKKRTHSITEISSLVGYEDTSAFCRAYKAHFGSSPSMDIAHS